MKREASIGVFISTIALIGMLAIPYVFPLIEEGQHLREHAAAANEATAERA